MNAADYAKKASDIFVISDSFIRIRELIDDSSSTVDDIADVILLDPALAASVLKLANSALFNYPGKIDTISKAVLVLGITEVYNLVITYFTKEAFNSVLANSEFLDNFWCRSVDCALLIKYLGARLAVPNAERLFVLGLLHNLGELVVQQLTPNKVLKCDKLTGDTLPWQKQLQVLNFTYGDCTAELLKIWQLPYTLVEPMRHQDDDDFEFSTTETKLLYIAKRIMLLDHQCRAHSLSSLIASEKLNELTINEELIAEANDFCDMERVSILAVLNPTASAVY